VKELLDLPDKGRDFKGESPDRTDPYTSSSTGNCFGETKVWEGDGDDDFAKDSGINST